MSIKRIIVCTAGSLAGLFFALAVPAWSSAQPLQIREHRVWRAEGGRYWAETLTVREISEEVLMAQMLVRTPNRNRLILANKTIPGREVMILNDEDTGWWATLEVTFDTLEAPPLADPVAYAAFVRSRNPPMTYSLRTSSGVWAQMTANALDPSSPLDKVLADYSAAGVAAELSEGAREGLGFFRKALLESDEIPAFAELVTLLDRLAKLDRRQKHEDPSVLVEGWEVGTASRSQLRSQADTEQDAEIGQAELDLLAAFPRVSSRDPLKDMRRSDWPK